MKVLIGDDHALFREGLRLQLEQLDPDIEIFEGNDFNATLTLAEELKGLDLVLVDLGMPGIPWQMALAKLNDLHPKLPVVVISGSDDNRIISEALDIGIAGYIPKSSSGEILIGALKLVLSGGTYLPPALLKRAGNGQPFQQAGIEREGPIELPPKLTPQQANVLALLAEGRSNKEIAFLMDIKEATVKIHVRGVMSALNVSNRTKAVVRAAQLGLVPIRN